MIAVLYKFPLHIDCTQCGDHGHRSWASMDSHLADFMLWRLSLAPSAFKHLVPLCDKITRCNFAVKPILKSQGKGIVLWDCIKWSDAWRLQHTPGVPMTIACAHLVSSEWIMSPLGSENLCIPCLQLTELSDENYSQQLFSCCVKAR